MPGRPNNTTVVDACARRLRALESYAGGSRGARTIAVNGRRLTVGEVAAIFEECVGSRADLAQKRATARRTMGKKQKEGIRGELAADERAVPGGDRGTAVDQGQPPTSDAITTR